MFHNIPNKIFDRMESLQWLDAKGRADGTERFQRLRQIPPETGKFLAIMAAASPEGKMLEIGTSGGYSTLWLALACQAINRKITTFEISKEKIEIAKETFQAADVEDVIELIHGDARDHISNYTDIAFCFLDIEKELYQDCYDLIVPRMVSGGLLVCDNAISHKDVLQPFVDLALIDERVDAVVVPIERGELVCWKV